MPTTTPPNATLSDGGFVAGSYDVAIGGYAYTLDTLDHDLPVSQADAMKADGTPKGGAFAIGKQKFAVKINAIAGIPAPAQLVPFAFGPHGYPSSWWTVTNLKISSANNGAVIRTYSADVAQLVNTPGVSAQ